MPAAAERLIEVEQSLGVGKFSLHQRVLGGEQRGLGIEHDQYVDRASLKLQLREFERAARLVGRILQSQLPFGGLLYGNQRVFDVAERGQYSLMVIGQQFGIARLAVLVLAAERTVVEDGLRH